MSLSTSQRSHAHDNDDDDVMQCTDEPLSQAEENKVNRLRKTSPQFNFRRAQHNAATGKQKLASLNKQLSPVDVYIVCFKKTPDERIRARVVTYLRNVAQGIVRGEQQCEQGYIYVFHDIGDPNTVLKVGRTSRTPTKRLAEWEKQLAPEAGKSIVLLTAYATCANRIAERVIHELLRCSRVSNRINPLDNNELEEFFEIENVLALALFVRGTINYIDAYCRYYRRLRNKQTA